MLFLIIEIEISYLCNKIGIFLFTLKIIEKARADHSAISSDRMHLALI